MAYTQTDLEQVRKALLDLATGQMVGRVTKDGRTVEFRSTQIGELKAMERDIIAELNPSLKKRTRTRQVITCKGL